MALASRFGFASRESVGRSQSRLSASLPQLQHRSACRPPQASVYVAGLLGRAASFSYHKHSEHRQQAQKTRVALTETLTEVEQEAAPSTPAVEQQPESQEAAASTPVVELVSHIIAATACITSLLVLKDKSDEKTVVSASLDKTLATWRISQVLPDVTINVFDSLEDGGVVEPQLPLQRQLHVTRVEAPGGPVFSMARQPNPPPGSVFAPSAHVLYVGNASKEVVAWGVNCGSNGANGASRNGNGNGAHHAEAEPEAAQFQTVATDYTGWVRSLAMMGKWLFSCGCNFLVQHDTSFPIPKEVSKTELFKGDITAIVASASHVYVGCADGCMRTWRVSSSGTLKKVAEAQAAHGSRITGLALHGASLYSCSLDGSIKAWDSDKLTLRAEVQNAHEGHKVNCIVLGSDGLLYTGGDDKLIRRWLPMSDAEVFLAALEPVRDEPGADPAAVQPPAELSQLLPPLAAHAAGVRVLAAGPHECLASGDAEGGLCIWAVQKPRSRSA